jgi:hypothetical protein
LGPEYVFKSADFYFREKDKKPSMVKYHVQIFRKRDMKLLGETISYSRGGGDFPSWWGESAYWWS